MKSVLIIGASHAGKSTTIREVCKRVNPTKVYRLHVDNNNLKNSQIELSEIDKIFNDTFIIEVQGKMIMVVAGAPTEQNIRITVLIEVCIQIGIDISFLLVSMRSFEKREGFDTPNELKNQSEIVLKEKIHKITDDNFINNIEWNQRIDKIVKIIKSSI